MFQNLSREMLMAPFEFSGIYLPSEPDFLRSVVQSRLDMKEELVGSVDTKSIPEPFTSCTFLN